MLIYLQHQLIDSDINTSKIMEITLLWRYCDEEFMNSLYKISLSICNILSIVAGPCNTVWSELSLKLMKFKLQDPSLALNTTSSGKKLNWYFHFSISFCKIWKCKIYVYSLRRRPGFYVSGYIKIEMYPWYPRKSYTTIP